MAKAVVRSLDALWLMASTGEPMAASEVASALGVNRAAAYRLLAELGAEGYVREIGTPKRFRITLKAVELGARVLDSLRVRDTLIRHLVDLAAETRLPTYLAFYDCGETVTTDVVADPTADRLTTRLIATRSPAVFTAVGTALLAAQSDEEVARVREGAPFEYRGGLKDADAFDRAVSVARENGYAATDNEFPGGPRGLAVAVHDQSGACVASFGVTLLGTPDDTQVLEAARRRARAASVALGHFPREHALIA